MAGREADPLKQGLKQDKGKDTIVITVGIGKVTVHGASHEVVVKKIGEK